MILWWSSYPIHRLMRSFPGLFTNVDSWVFPMVSSENDQMIQRTDGAFPTWWFQSTHVGPMWVPYGYHMGTIWSSSNASPNAEVPFCLAQPPICVAWTPVKWIWSAAKLLIWDGSVGLIWMMCWIMNIRLYWCASVIKLYGCMYVWMYERTYVRTYVCICVYMCTVYMHMSIIIVYIYIDIIWGRGNRKNCLPSQNSCKWDLARFLYEFPVVLAFGKRRCAWSHVTPSGWLHRVAKVLACTAFTTDVAPWKIEW